jgi:hypothetical protein
MIGLLNKIFFLRYNFILYLLYVGQYCSPIQSTAWFMLFFDYVLDHNLIVLLISFVNLFIKSVISCLMTQRMDYVSLEVPMFIIYILIGMHLDFYPLVVSDRWKIFINRILFFPQLFVYLGILSKFYFCLPLQIPTQWLIFPKRFGYFK